MSASSLPESVVEAAPEAPAAIVAPWPFAKRFLFAATVFFFVLPNFPFPLDVIPGLVRIAIWVTKFWDAVVPIVATRVFHVAADVKPNGSGDTTYNYVQVAL